MTDLRPILLIVEDDPATQAFLADNLAADGYQVLVADSGRHALHLAEHRAPDLAIVDVGLPDGSGLELVAGIRAADGIASRLDPDLPIVVVSGRGTELDRVRGFERGADDYVVKPFSYAELRARIRAVLTRTDRRERRGTLRVGGLEIDPATREARLHGERLELSAKEFSLLRALATEPTRVYTKEELLRGVWGFQALGRTRTLDSHACRLRRKLGVSGDRYIVNVWGVGYRLIDPVVAA